MQKEIRKCKRKIRKLIIRFGIFIFIISLFAYQLSKKTSPINQIK